MRIWLYHKIYIVLYRAGITYTDVLVINLKSGFLEKNPTEWNRSPHEYGTNEHTVLYEIQNVGLLITEFICIPFFSIDYEPYRDSRLTVNRD